MAAQEVFDELEEIYQLPPEEVEDLVGRLKIVDKIDTSGRRCRVWDKSGDRKVQKGRLVKEFRRYDNDDVNRILNDLKTDKEDNVRISDAFSMYLALDMLPKVKSYWNTLFNEHDHQRNGKLDREELDCLFISLGIFDERKKYAMKQIEACDKDGDDEIDWPEMEKYLEEDFRQNCARLYRNKLAKVRDYKEPTDIKDEPDEPGFLDKLKAKLPGMNPVDAVKNVPGLSNGVDKLKEKNPSKNPADISSGMDKLKSMAGNKLAVGSMGDALKNVPGGNTLKEKLESLKSNGDTISLENLKSNENALKNAPDALQNLKSNGDALKSFPSGTEALRNIQKRMNNGGVENAKIGGSTDAVKDIANSPKGGASEEGLSFFARLKSKFFKKKPIDDKEKLVPATEGKKLPKKPEQPKENNLQLVPATAVVPKKSFFDRLKSFFGFGKKDISDNKVKIPVNADKKNLAVLKSGKSSDNKKVRFDPPKDTDTKIGANGALSSTPHAGSSYAAMMVFKNDVSDDQKAALRSIAKI